MATGPKPIELQASAKSATTPYERLAVACALAGVLSVALAGWLAWKPLAPLAIGVALLYVAYLAATGARSEAWVERRKR